MWLHLKKLDWPLIIAVLLLVGVGLLTIYSIDSSHSLGLFKKQVNFAAIGILIMFGLSFFDYRNFKNHSALLIFLYLFSILLLVLVLIIGSKIRGAQSWFQLGAFNLQPVEITKITVILLLAKYFSLRHIEMYRIKHIVVSGLYVALPVILVIVQPDLGSVLVLLVIWLGIMLIAGIKIRHLLILGLIAVVITIGSWYWLLEDYHKNRIITFVNPQLDPYGHGYNVVQSLIAVGSGRMTGLGIDQASQSQLNFLPEQQTDFIYATYAEEWGFVGVVVLFFIFAFLFWRMILAALNAENNFSRLFISGLIAMIFFQLVISIGMNMALLPVIGLTLPLLSYGGSSLITIFIGLGVLLSIKAR